jgi:hypothetical protein
MLYPSEKEDMSKVGSSRGVELHIDVRDVYIAIESLYWFKD